MGILVKIFSGSPTLENHKPVLRVAPRPTIIRFNGGVWMNKADLVATISKDAGITKDKANTAIDSLVGSITKGLKKGGRVTLVGFGTWYTSKRKARTGRNPQTGETIQIKAKRVARFKAGKELETAVK